MHRKGLTPIVTVVLLLMLAIVVFGTAFMWVTKMQQKSQTETSKQLNERTVVLSLNLDIISVYKDDNGNISIVIMNKGEKPIPGDWLNGSIIKIDNVITNAFHNPDVDVPPGGTATYTSSYPFSSIADRKVHVIDINVKGRDISVTCGPLEPDANACEI